MFAPRRQAVEGATGVVHHLQSRSKDVRRTNIPTNLLKGKFYLDGSTTSAARSLKSVVLLCLLERVGRRPSN